MAIGRHWLSRPLKKVFARLQGLVASDDWAIAVERRGSSARAFAGSDQAAATSSLGSLTRL